MHVSVNGVRLFFDIEGAKADCGHACMPDAPERTTAAIRDFITRSK